MTVHNIYNLRDALLELRTESLKKPPIGEGYASYLCCRTTNNAGAFATLMEYCVVNNKDPLSGLNYRVAPYNTLKEDVLLHHDIGRVVHECSKYGFDPTIAAIQRMMLLRAYNELQ